MKVDTNVAPGETGQAPEEENNQSPPADGQGDVESSQATPPDNDGSGEEEVSDKVASGGEPVKAPEEEVTPYWQSKGFKSEDDFAASYEEQHRTITRASMEAGDLKRANEIYRKKASGELDEDVNVEEFIAAENKKVKEATEKQSSQKELATEQAALAIDRFKIRHHDLNLTVEDVEDIVSMAATSQSNNYLDRLEHGFNRLQRQANVAKANKVKDQQTEMKKNADLGPGSAGGEKPSDAPDWKNMSSEDFNKRKQDIARG